FDFSGFSGGHFSRAENAFAFAAWNQGGTEAKVLRFHNGEWHEQSIENTLAYPSGFVSPSEDEPPAMVAVFYGDGTRLIHINPIDGSRLLYVAHDDGTYILTETCDALTTEVPTQAVFRAVAVDEDIDTLYLG